jgi:hypothetical protein
MIFQHSLFQQIAISRHMPIFLWLVSLQQNIAYFSSKINFFTDILCTCMFEFATEDAIRKQYEALIILKPKNTITDSSNLIAYINNDNFIHNWRNLQNIINYGACMYRTDSTELWAVQDVKGLIKACNMRHF